jgi:hypothetical protein
LSRRGAPMASRTGAAARTSAARQGLTAAVLDAASSEVTLIDHRFLAHLLAEQAGGAE